jgi:16S rRNA (guanine966-N2)-methyltransferase
MSRSDRGGSRPGQVRIIGGTWRGRKLAFDPAEGLRPTGDRIRETLFNWLAGDIHGARCADLFTGTGALGLEALSRGAAHCDFVDASPVATSRVGEHLATLHGTDRGRCHTCAARQFLKGATAPYDIVFIDPPFGLDLVADTCVALAEGNLLREQGLVYVESGADSPPPPVPPNWRLHRDKVAGAVAYRLYRVEHTTAWCRRGRVVAARQIV